VPFSRTEPNVPGWEEDANSPFVATAASGSKQFTIKGSFDQVLLLINGPDTSADADKLQVNGTTTATYDATDVDGDGTFDATGFPLGLGVARYAEIRLAGRADGSLGFSATPQSFGANLTVSGNNPNISVPVNTITLDAGSGTTFDFRARVYGLEV